MLYVPYNSRAKLDKAETIEKHGKQGGGKPNIVLFISDDGSSVLTKEKSDAIVGFDTAVRSLRTPTNDFTFEDLCVRAPTGKCSPPSGHMRFWGGQASAYYADGNVHRRPNDRTHDLNATSQ